MFIFFFALVIFLVGCNANKVAVIFDTNGGNYIESIEVDYNTVIPLPENNPTKEGFAFLGWYLDKKFKNKYTDQIVKKNTTLYAKWEAKLEVKLDSDGGSSIASQFIEKGKKALEPTAPVKQGYQFLGWYNGNSIFDFNTPISSSITLVAKWKRVDGLFDYDESNKVTISN